MSLTTVLTAAITAADGTLLFERPGTPAHRAAANSKRSALLGLTALQEAEAALRALDPTWQPTHEHAQPPAPGLVAKQARLREHRGPHPMYDGTLAPGMMKVYLALREHGPCTPGELARHLPDATMGYTTHTLGTLWMRNIAKREMDDETFVYWLAKEVME